MKRVAFNLMKGAGSAALLMAATSLGAQAADLERPYAAHDWTGPYIGALIAVGGYDTEGDFDNDSDTEAHRLGALGEVSILGGAQVGWNFQSGNMVFGIEGDISATAFDRAVAEPDLNDDDAVVLEGDYFATARGRIGIADNDVLLFATAGAAFIGGSLSNTETDDSIDVDAVGGVVGAGIEWAATPTLSVKVEGLYAFFDKTIDLNNELGEGTDDDFFRIEDMVVARLGVNWHFNGAANDGSYDIDETDRDWTGPYIGALVGAGAVQTGGIFDSSDESSSGIFLAQSSTVGVMGGGTVGWNIQNGQMVFGLEGDISFVDWDETSFQATNTPDGINFESELFATARGRVGYADGDLLVYGTAGVAFLTGELSDAGGSGGADGVDVFATGAVFGVGMEWAATESVTVKAEGLYVHFNDATSFEEAGAADTGDAFELQDAAIARLGVNWAFPAD